MEFFGEALIAAVERLDTENAPYLGTEIDKLLQKYTEIQRLELIKHAMYRACERVGNSRYGGNGQPPNTDTASGDSILKNIDSEFKEITQSLNQSLCDENNEEIKKALQNACDALKSDSYTCPSEKE